VTPIDAIPVLPPHGFIKVLHVAGSDLDIVNAARVSFARESMTLVDADVRLLGYLLRNRHGTPFEHTFMRFHIKAPIFVMREWHRHRIGVSINEESARYTQLMPEFYLPTGDGWREQIGRPGQYRYVPITDEQKLGDLRAGMLDAYNRAYSTYERLLNAGVAKEIARAVLPVGTYSSMHWTCNARSLMAFLTLRNAPSAQYEIRQYAIALEEAFKHSFPHTHAHYVEEGRVAP